MTSRDLILVGAGLVVGYFLVGVVNKNKANTNQSGGTALPDTSSQTVPPSAIGDGITNNPILSFISI